MPSAWDICEPVGSRLYVRVRAFGAVPESELHTLRPTSFLPFNLLHSVRTVRISRGRQVGLPTLTLNPASTLAKNILFFT